MASVQLVAAAGLVLVVFVMLANLLVFVYGRGAVRAALDEGARAGSRWQATTQDCEARARGVLAQLLGGGMREGVAIGCSQGSTATTASAEVRFAGWLALVPDWSFDLHARATREREP